MINKTNKAGYVMYFTGIGFLGMVNFLIKDFAMTWPRPLPETLQFLNPAMAYITGVLLVLAAVFCTFKKIHCHCINSDSRFDFIIAYFKAFV